MIYRNCSKESSILLTPRFGFISSYSPNTVFQTKHVNEFSTNPFKRFFNYFMYLSSDVRTLKEFCLLNEAQHCRTATMEAFRGSYQSAFALPPHIPRQSDSGLISTAALSQRTVRPFTSQLSSFASDPFLKKNLLGICTCRTRRRRGTLYSMAVLYRGWLGRGRLCVTSNEVLSECVLSGRCGWNPLWNVSLLSQQRWMNNTSQLLYLSVPEQN